ncbi:hypothetical protein [Dactylosporangium sp. NPDC048998]|uniref:hypothetical protein n=1 Tax=Dactylosporangium sp. NPDC048998 TaxID=3363976 RepID=UPI00371832EC
MRHYDQVTSEPNPVDRDDRPVIAVNDRGLMLGLDAEGTWIIWNEDDTVWPLHTVWLAYDHLMWLMPLLQKPPEVVMDAICGAEAGSGLMPAVLRYALGCWSYHWAGLALARSRIPIDRTPRRAPSAEGLHPTTQTRATPGPSLVAYGNGP